MGPILRVNFDEISRTLPPRYHSGGCPLISKKKKRERKKERKKNDFQTNETRKRDEIGRFADTLMIAWEISITSAQVCFVSFV